MRVVIVGGGAGGLELATKLGRKLGRGKKAEIVLVDHKPVHIWKPLLHEVASGSLDAAVDAVSYRAHAHLNGYMFKLGRLEQINSEDKSIQLAAIKEKSGEEILPVRFIKFDYLVVAIGSVSNDFGVEGVSEFCHFLDSHSQAVDFHERLVNNFIRLNQQLENNPEKRLHIAIVGGGATGVELSAELLRAREWFSTYGLKNVRSEHLEISLIEAGPRVLPALSESISESVIKELTRRGVRVWVNTQISEAKENTLLTNDGNSIAADTLVWAAGIKAPEFLKLTAGIETNNANQIIVTPTLQTQQHPTIFAMGDCAGLEITEASGAKKWVPPRAQSAHQMASQISSNIIRLVNNKKPAAFSYRDYGSLVSLSDYTAFGRLMGGIGGGSLNVQGRIARYTYVSLYRLHQSAIHGYLRTALLMISDKLNRFLRPRLKLH